MARHFAILISGACLLFAAFAQVATEVQSSQETSVEGRVTDALTMAGVAHSRILITSPAANLQVTTDADGRYKVSNLPSEGSYAFRYGVRTPGYIAVSRTIRISRGEHLTGINVHLSREAVIAGRVMGSNKEPVANAWVVVRLHGFVRGRPTVNRVATSRTDDRGEYRVSGLQPGQYLVEAGPEQVSIVRVDRKNAGSVEDRSPTVSPVATYFVASPGSDGASPVYVRSGERRDDVDIILVEQKTVCIASAAIDPAGSDRARLEVALAEPYPGGSWPVAYGAVSSGDRFEICGVGSGQYRLYSYTSAAGKTRYAFHLFTVSDRGLSLPPLVLNEAQELNGALDLPGKETELTRGTSFRVSLEPKERIHFPDEVPDIVLSNRGPFTIRSVLPGEYWVDVFGLPSRTYIASIATGAGEAYRQPLCFPCGDLKIAIGMDGPIVQGQVLDKKDQPLAHATVVLAASPLPAKMAPNEINVIAADQKGNFTVDNISPGKYVLMAFPGVDASLAGNPEFLRAQLSGGSEVTLFALETKLLRPPVIELNR